MSILEFKCPNCSGAITFDPSAQILSCPFCNSVIDVQAMAASETELGRAQVPEEINWSYNGQEWGEGEQDGLSVYTCKSCAGEIIGEETLGATSCPFCGNRIVITSKFSGTLRPDVIIPFKIGKEQALTALKQHYQKKILLPKAFKEENHLDEIKGVYVPFWLFDAEVDASIVYDAATINEDSRRNSDLKYVYIEGDHYEVIREGGVSFNHLPIDGSEAIDDTLMESIEPFSFNEAVGFNTSYLAGYFANKYDLSVEECMERANTRIRSSADEEFRKTVSQRYFIVRMRYANMRLKSWNIRYALMPVWFLSTSWNGDNYLYAMNGQTGKFVGDLPMDKEAYGKWFRLLFIIPFVALLIFLSQVMA